MNMQESLQSFGKPEEDKEKDPRAGEALEILRSIETGDDLDKLWINEEDYLEIDKFNVDHWKGSLKHSIQKAHDGLAMNGMKNIASEAQYIKDIETSLSDIERDFVGKIDKARLLAIRKKLEAVWSLLDKSIAA